MLSSFRLGLVLTLAVAAAACERVPLLAPTESTIIVAADTSVLAPGGRAQITATVAEQGGTPVQNGTLVRFSATLGRVEPAEVETRGGSATATFIAGTSSGTAEIRATSGAAGAATIGEGANATSSNIVRITIGGAASASVVVSADPSRLGPAGGTTTITASVLDTAGNRLSGVPVTFSTDAGSLSSSSALTDGNGDARVSLTTSRTAKVTARTGGGDSGRTGEVTVTIAPASTLSLSLSASSVQAGSSVTLTVTAAADTSPRVVVNWGDGTTTDLGTISGGGNGRPVAHVYQSPGSYTITAVATADGGTFTASTSVSVTARPAISVNLAANPTTATRCTPITFTAQTGGDTNASFSSFRWTIDSNESSEDHTVTTSGNQLTRVFWQTGRKTVSVTAETTDGRSGDAQTQVVITETTPPSDGSNCR